MAIEFAKGSTIGDGRYRIEHRLGSGGMAAVWLANDERLHRKVAVKALSDLLADDPAYVRRFSREARVAAGLSHPSLVRVFDFGDDPSPYLVMEFIEGGTLAERLRRDDLPHPDALEIGRVLLEALSHVHGARIVHRDIKPANVLLDANEAPRLTDFGIAQPEDATQLTKSGGILGTMRYLAPEVLHGAPASPASDLYSLGILLRECSGSELPQGILRDLIKWLTADDPGDRPASADDALAFLEEVDPTGATVALPAKDSTATTGRLMPTAREVLRDVLPAAPRPRMPAMPVPRELPDGRREYQLKSSPRVTVLLIGAVVAAVVVFALIAGGNGGSSGGRTPASAPDAPLSRQLDDLQRDVRALK